GRNGWGHGRHGHDGRDGDAATPQHAANDDWHWPVRPDRDGRHVHRNEGARWPCSQRLQGSWSIQESTRDRRPRSQCCRGRRADAAAGYRPSPGNEDAGNGNARDGHPGHEVWRPSRSLLIAGIKFGIAIKHSLNPKGAAAAQVDFIELASGILALASTPAIIAIAHEGHQME